MSSSSEREFGSVRLSESIAGPEDIAEIVKVSDSLNEEAPFVQNDIVQLKKPMIGKTYLSGHFHICQDQQWHDLSASATPPEISSHASGSVDVVSGSSGAFSQIDYQFDHLIPVSGKKDEVYLAELVVVKVEDSKIVSETSLVRMLYPTAIAQPSASGSIQIPFMYSYLSDLSVSFAVKYTFRNGSTIYDFIDKNL